MLHVTCAIIEHEGKVLICQRSERMKLPLKWEFPGGKVETKESKEECLKREIREELGIDIKIGQELSRVEHHYSDFSLYLYPFICKLVSGKLFLTEHIQARWVDKGQLPDYDWAAADVPVMQEYLYKKRSKK
ncbi:MAG TPA: (deoxy)nucleoside triphosphate pyrophosphohydrolase [Sphingobacterium sp.]|mgnify:CR=1 FL=1|nr:(deoxy)nucleoside triphosphate pyrophosphohydrolase [Sphingobacterium sp.]